MFEEFDLKNLSNSHIILNSKIDETLLKIDSLLKQKNKTYNNFMKPYQELIEDINNFITPIFHINSVKNSKITQEVYIKCLPIINEYETTLNHNVDIYNILKSIQYNHNIHLKDIQNIYSFTIEDVDLFLEAILNNDLEFNINGYKILDIKYNKDYILNLEQLEVITKEIKDFELNGCNLDNKNKDKIKDINLQLSNLEQQFSQNILDSTNNYEMIIDNYLDVENLPISDLEASSFKDKNEGTTKYKFTLHTPSYISYMTYGKSRRKREQLYKAYTTRASQNEDLIVQILNLKNQKSKILGFDNTAQYSLANKMAKDENSVISFLESLVKKSKNSSLKELLEIEQIALELDNIKDIQSYDISYYSHKLKKLKYSIDEEYYRDFFEQRSVLEGFFEFLHKLFDIKFIEVQTLKWDDKVKVYDIYETNNKIARIYLDLENRSDKRDGAWMNNWHTHYINSKNKRVLPTAYIVCNFPKSSSTNPSLLRHDDIVTLFHEMGHALHHILSKVKEPFISGVNGVAWDVIEFPSQFLEYFAYDKEVLQLFSKHYKTKEILSDNHIENLIKTRNFQSSLFLSRQLEFAIFDFKIHQKLYTNKEDIQNILDDIRDELSIIKPPSYNKFQNSFSHIFSGGYSAGYYSYKWAEVLSADAFYLFKKSNTFNKDLSKKYKENILYKGSSLNMNKLFYDFTSKDPSVDSLLKIDGIIN